MRTHRRDAGFSLVEMLVTIVMTTIVAGSITTVVIATLKHQKSLQVRGSVLAQARNTLEQVDRDIRSANPLCYATGTTVEMLEADANPSSIVVYTVNSSNQLIYIKFQGLTSCPATLPNVNPAVPPSGTTRTIHRIVASNLVNTGSAPVFTQPTAAAYDNCQGGTAPNATTQAAAQALPTLRVSIQVQPTPLKNAVPATDCGADIRNYGATATPTATASATA
ncbi:MAG TPA: prepilin-type N-terminal cleavage/methylation domain-containing protein [Mycobacteriales bacterium]|nr:prepilin-type N-terminal cleavage/methylation domain-containing protein [Mycobacteriales bacterium]